MPKSVDKNQLSFFDEVTEVTPKVMDALEERVIIAELMAQIKRDTETLTMDPMFHNPDRQFYVDRIDAYRQEIQRRRQLP